MKLLFVVLIIATVGILIHSTQGVCYDEVEENHVPSADPTLTSTDFKWLDAVTTWYIPLWNKIQLWKNAERIFGTDGLHAMPESSLIENTCPVVTWGGWADNGWNETLTMFQGQSVDYINKYDKFRHGVGNSFTTDLVYVATHYLTITDNATYAAWVRRYEDGKKGFWVASTVKKLQLSKLEEIVFHMEQLGFNPKHFVQSKYALC